MNDILKPRTISFKLLTWMSLRVQNVIRYKRRLPEQILPLYGGSTWWSLTRNACAFYLDFIQKYPNVQNNTFCAEEVLPHSVLMNSEFSVRSVSDNLRYIDWSGRGGQFPSTLTLDDLPVLKTGKFMFARKFDSVKSRDLMGELGFLSHGSCVEN